MSDLDQDDDSRSSIKNDSDDSFTGKVNNELIEAILGEMKSEFNKSFISEVKKEKVTKCVNAESSSTNEITQDNSESAVKESCQESDVVSNCDTKSEVVGEDNASEKPPDLLNTSSKKGSNDVQDKDCSDIAPLLVRESDGNVPCILITLNSNCEVVENPQSLKKLKIESSIMDENSPLKSKTEDQPTETSVTPGKRSLRSQKVLPETPELAIVKRSARRRSKDSPRESVLQSAIARKEKSFSNLSHSEEKSCSSRNLKVSSFRSPRLSSVERAQTGKSRSSTVGEKGKPANLPKSPRLLSQVGLLPSSSTSKSETQSNVDTPTKPLGKTRSSSEFSSSGSASDNIKQEPGSKPTSKSPVPANAPAAYTKTGKRRYKPFKGLRYSFTSGPAKRSKIGRRSVRERPWQESNSSLNMAPGRTISTRNTRTTVLQKEPVAIKREPEPKKKNLYSKTEKNSVSVTSHLAEKGNHGGAGRSDSPVVAEACQTAVHKRKMQPSMEDDIEDISGKRSRHNHVPSPSPADANQGPSKPESTAISSGAGTAALCCCQTKSQLFVTARGHSGASGAEMYCQAVDSLENRTVGCSNTIGTIDVRMCRPSVKVPYMILCEVHLNRLLRHNCCPGCGLFCTQGRFFQCASMHFYHEECQLLVKDKSLCPHCGLDSPQNECILTFGTYKNPVFLPQQKPPKKYPAAKMSFGRSPASREEQLDDVPTIPSFSLTLPNGRSVTAEGLSNTIDRDKLGRLLNVLCNVKDPGPGAVSPVQARYTPKTLYHAAKSGNTEKLLAALASGVNPNHQFRDNAMGTALHAACTGNHLTVVHILLQAGAQADMMDRDQHTPLMIAAMAGHNSIVKYLVKAGACVTLKGADGMTALHLAAKAGNLEACHYLLSTPNVGKTFIDVVDDGGWTPLVWAAEHCHTNVARYLLDKKADPLIRDAEQNIALHWSAFSGSVDITEMLLNYGCPVNCTNTHGDTPLHIGARQNMYSCVLLLLTRGADVNKTNNSGDTPQNCCHTQSNDCFRAIVLNKELQSITRKSKKREMRLLCNDISRGKETNPIQCVNNEDSEGEPRDYMYVSENCFTSNIFVSRTITSLQACRCEDTCSTKSCLCGNISLRCWYDDDGRLSSDFNYADPPMLFECNQACACNCVTCNNRVVQSGLTARFQLFRTRSKGWGVRTLQPILKGTYVCEYIGEVISDCEADHREDDSYLFDLDNKDGETYCIDARHYGNVARFINHMCVPNLQPVRVFIDHQDLHFPRIAFFANQDIAAEEELGFDYGEKFWIIKCKSFTCTCGASSCRYSELTISQTLENYRARLQEDSVDH
ncbi:hypothetical protein R5R35_011296 [Gryllus longicercus]|uniref:Histone-lysine N-methyltransferase EHMT2 n=1 Tax=Gryllus longicercus TaxID=2509291 RepID=A0AAN9WQZ9_9ORTH